VYEEVGEFCLASICRTTPLLLTCMQRVLLSCLVVLLYGTITSYHMASCLDQKELQYMYMYIVSTSMVYVACALEMPSPPLSTLLRAWCCSSKTQMARKLARIEMPVIHSHRPKAYLLCFERVLSWVLRQPLYERAWLFLFGRVI
jgi:hypothetical protein